MSTRCPVRILHVDDEPAVTDLAKVCLERERDEFVIETEQDPREVVSRLEAESIDCIVSDFDMPGMDGLELLERVRETYPELPFILFTGKGTEEIASRAISAGVTDYFQKGSSTDQYAVLANRIEHAVSQYQTERRLARQTDLFEKAQSIADVGAWEVDVDGEETFFSDHAYRLIGSGPSAAETVDTIVGAVHQNDRDRVRRAFDRAVERAEPFDLEVRLDDGQPRWVRLRADPQHDEGGVARLRGTVQDITERKERELTLEQYRTAVETADDAVYVLDASGRIAIVNRSFETWVGRDRDSLIGTDAGEVLPPGSVDDQAAVRSSLLCTDGSVETFTFRDREAENGTSIYEATVSPVDTRAGDRAGSIGIVRDITGERERQELLAGLFEESLDGIGVKEIVTDENGDPIDYVYLRVNDRFEELTGLEADEVIGERVTDVIEGIEDTPFIEIFGEVALEDTTARFEQYSAPLDRHYEVSAFSTKPGRVITIFSDITERKKQEQTIRRLNERLQLAIEGAKLGVWDWDMTTDEVEFNDQWAEMLDYDPDEIEDDLEAWHQRVHPADWPDVEAAIEAHRSGATDRYETEHRLRTAGGDWKWIRDVGRIVERAEDGTPERAVGVHIDITEQKESERELKRFKQFVEYSPDFVVVLDGDLKVEYQSPTSPFFEWEPLEITGENPIENIHPEDRSRLLESYDRLLSSPEEVVKSEFRAKDADGNWQWLESRGQNFLGEEPIDGILLTIRSITDRKEKERRVARYSRALEALQGTTNDLLAASDREAAARRVVESIESVLEFDFVGIWLSDASRSRLEPAAVSEAGREIVPDPPTYTPTEPSLSWAAFEEEETRQIEDVYEHEERYNDETPIRSELIVPLGEYGLLNIGSTDVGGFSDRDVALVELWAETVTSALARIEQLQRLRERERELTRERDRLDEFASFVSHDLQNPLNVAIGRLDQVAEDCDSEHLETIERSLDRMERLIDDLLTLSRQGSNVGEREPVRLDSLLDGCWSTVGSGDASVVCRTDATVRADRSRLATVFENLLANAIVHGGEDVTIEVGDLEDRDGFYLEDDGPGIPSDERDNVFESGYTTAADGTGIGLAIVKQVVDAHGWSIDVTESEAGGPRFEVYDVDSG